ncbi:response regulator [Candidatus Uhrbacteria bacterium]|jgi:CheY-like chemotaxis protein|nr:response regulator [Candidatus Uhrbacteria bacterium]
MNKNCTVLIVDDDEFLRSVYTEQLSKGGVDVVSAANGLEAMEYVENQMPSIILLDVMMPKMNGFEFLEKLRGIDGGKDVEVVMLTNLGQESDKLEAGRFGVTKYLVKTEVKIQDIIDIIHVCANETKENV